MLCQSDVVQAIAVSACIAGTHVAGSTHAAPDMHEQESKLAAIVGGVDSGGRRRVAM